MGKGRKHKPIEMGVRFGRLTVAGFLGTRNGFAFYRCQCDCGNIPEVQASLLRRGATTSCGCYRLERIREARAKNRIVPDSPRDPIVAVWRSIVFRCCNPKSPAYQRYGGRGITVCKRWQKSVQAFLKDMGPRPTPRHTVERIVNGKGYSPGNCRWATRKEQARNRPSRNVYLTCDGRTMLMVEWAEELGVKLGTLHARKKMGWADEKIVRTPVRSG